MSEDRKMTDRRGVPMQAMHFHLQADLVARLDAIATRLGITRSQAMRQLLMRGVWEMEMRHRRGGDGGQ